MAKWLSVRFGTKCLWVRIPLLSIIHKKLLFSQVVHGEQYTEIVAPLPTEGKVTSTSKVVDVLDKKKFCQIIQENEVFNDQGQQIARNQFVALFLGTSGVGRRGRSNLQVNLIIVNPCIAKFKTLKYEGF